MVQVYTIDELVSYKPYACLPEGVDLNPFNELVEQVRQLLKQLDEINPNRRRSINTKPRKPKQPKEIVDEDGWTTAIPIAKKEDLEGSAIADDDDFEEPKANKKNNKKHQVKSKINASKISSGKSSSANGSDTIALTNTSRFNVYAALGGSEDEDDDEDDE